MKFVKNMFGWKSKSKRKGITPVIAIVLLLMMTVAAAGMAYVWIMSLQEDIEEQANEGIRKQQTDASAVIAIESVWEDSVTGNIFFMLRNSGTHTFTTAQVSQFGYYIDGAPATPATICTAVNLNAQGTTCQVETATPFPAAAGDKVQISVKSPVGRSTEYSCRLKMAGDTSC